MPHDPQDGGPRGPGSAVRAASARSAPARSALARLVGDAGNFAESSWGREPVLCRAADPGAFADLLSEGAVDELVAERGLRTPFVRVAQAGSTLPHRAFTAPGGVGAGVADQVSDDKLSALFAAGSTIVLQGLHRVWPPVIDFCQQLAADLGHPVQANAYVTPPQNQGFDDHYDVHDVFVLQVAGRKRWSIHAPVLASPLRDQPWTDRRDAVRLAAEQEPVLETVLEPGDALYLPRGWLHSATALGGVTVHLTLGVHSWTRYAVAEELVALALQRLTDDEEARGSLPLGTSLLGDELDLDLVGKRLREALDSVGPDDVAQRLRTRRRDAQRAAPLGPLAQHALAAALSEETVLRLRSHLDATLLGATLASRAGTVSVAQVPDAVVEALLAGDRVTAGDLGQEAARRLVEAGLVVAG
ncbi:putative ribosomal oxygenase [Nocardioides dokdonensis FR1436]|uniref:Putative ribosomal oxygenase n=1 Tax=Nocardioides dokdonensis FR1436 TaxID=1300347 RepID=A0A1A9GP81_9ACTN|nr:cupin domain-containing protein [Nocardioides dokdonensis]ANH39245.1 putative ribosomal oxygenase [Nocardioides dokdonensis FR1436]